MTVCDDIIIGAFLFINMCAFVIMFWDKSRSRDHGARRVSEGMLFFMAVIGGGVGVLTGMMWLHHKTRKWYFVIGIPLLIVQNIIVMYVIHTMLVQFAPLSIDSIICVQ